MKRILHALLIVPLISIAPAISAQILPREGSSLNYRLIGFSFPPGAGKYKLEIANGNCTTEKVFSQNKIISIPAKKNKVTAEVPSFGSQYTWRIIYKGHHTSGKQNTFYHFTTSVGEVTDTSIHRLRILQRARKHKDAFVFLDACKALYDMNGKLVWFLPETPQNENKTVIRDLKATANGTITYIIDDHAGYEISYSGEVLWKTPANGALNGDSSEHCHHEFTRLDNGNYMTIGMEMLYVNFPVLTDSSRVALRKSQLPPGFDRTIYRSTPMGTLIEYDHSGNVVWSWRLSDHLKELPLAPADSWINPHENSFFFDEKERAVYLSCRNPNSIIKIKYPEGSVMNIYTGSIATKKNGGSPDDLFCAQHSCSRSADGYLYLFNNNSCIAGGIPRLVAMKEPSANKDSLKKIWEYQCTIEPSAEGEIKGIPFMSGGNVTELPDHSFFASMGLPYSKVLIVNRKKKILWSAVAEKFDTDKKKWESINLYRASIIPDRKELERIIWHEEAIQ